MFDSQSSPIDRIERHFDDRDRMYPAADLLRIVAGHKNDATCRRLLPWMISVETSLEFVADLEIEAASTNDARERASILRDAVRSAQGVRQLMDAFNPTLVDDPELFADTVQAVDQAFDKRIGEWKHALRGAAPESSDHVFKDASDGNRGLRGRVQNFLARYVERREAPPSELYQPLEFIRQRLEAQRPKKNRSGADEA